MPSDFEQYLRSVLRYEPETGKFYWTASLSRHAKAGAEAGGVSNHGYVRICVNRRKYLAHRLAWFLQTGSWPPKGAMLDHANRDRTDNRWANIRLATPTENSANASLRSDNQSGASGVNFHRGAGKWRAYARRDGKQVHLGLFDAREDAVDAARAASINLHGAFSPHLETTP